jgi:hypothetical protein
MHGSYCTVLIPHSTVWGCMDMVLKMQLPVCKDTIAPLAASAGCCTFMALLALFVPAC